MARPCLSNYRENPLDLEKLKKKPQNPNNLKSFRAFLLSICLYISVFYVFNLSPSALFCTTKFWFIISNTIILIIAADFDAFSSTKEHKFYHDYYYSRDNNHDPIPKSSIASTTVPSFEIIEYPRVEKPKYEEKKRVDERRSESHLEKIIAMIEAPGLENKTEKVVDSELIEKNEVKVMSGGSEETEEGGREKVKRRRVIKRVTFSDIKTDKIKMHDDELESCEKDDDDDEFSRMSNEEVNRRVEDFIRRFNNQIRLQAATNRRQHSQLQHYYQM